MQKCSYLKFKKYQVFSSNDQLSTAVLINNDDINKTISNLDVHDNTYRIVNFLNFLNMH